MRNWPVGAALPLANVKLLAPIPRPRKNIFGIGLNYVEHVAESSRALDTARELPKQPVIFSKPPTSVIGPDDAIAAQQEDHAATRLGGRTRRRDGADRAPGAARPTRCAYVFGYSVMIDVSARDNRRAGQWIYSKGQDTYAPFGPCIVTADEIADPHALDLWLTVNGVEKQRSNTRHMLFKVPLLIADISAAITLEPGDIIATGTPDGVGAGRNAAGMAVAGRRGRGGSDRHRPAASSRRGGVRFADAVRHGNAGSAEPLQDPDRRPSRRARSPG